MRLPFGLGRRSSSGNGAGTAAGAGAGFAPGGSAGSSGAAPEPASTGAWADLPPIQRTVGEMPQVAAPGSFAEALPGSRSLPPIVQPLGHEVNPLANPGLVVARARPVEVGRAGTLPAPVQRQAARRAGRPTVSAWTEPGAPAADHAHEATGASMDHVPGAASTPTIAPIRSLPTVSRQSVHVPARPLTSAAIAATPPVQRAPAAASPARGASAPAPATGGMRRAPSASLPAPGPVVSRQAPAATSTPDAPVPSAAAVTPSSQAQEPARRGLGAPLAALPSSARPVGTPAHAAAALPVSRLASAQKLSAAAIGRRPVQRDQAADDEVHADAVSAAPAVQTSRAAHADLPALPVLPARPAARVAATPAPPAVQTAPAAQAAGPVTRPILGARPLQPSFRLQRSAAASDAGDDDAPSDALPSPWWAPASESATAGAPLASPAAGDSIPTVSRSAGAWQGTDDAPGAARALQRSAPARSSRTFTSAPGIQRATAPAALPPVVRPVAATVVRGGGEGTAAAPVLAAQRAVAAAPPASVPSVQMSAAPSVITVPSQAPAGSQGSPVVQREGGNASSTPGAANGTTERDLEELAQALFGRIRSRLRSELIHDREAKGLTFDNV